MCRKMGVHYDFPAENENKAEEKNRKRRLNRRIQTQKSKLDFSTIEIPDPPSPSGNVITDNFLDCIRTFEIEQMSYQIRCCQICHE